MNQQEKPTTAAQVTEATIEAWKKQCPTGLFCIEVEDKKGYVRKPNRNDIKYALSRLKGGSELDMAEALLEEIWLGGDKEILEDDDYFLGASTKVQELVKTKDAELVKL